MSEEASELIYALANLLGFYHDTILRNARLRASGAPQTDGHCSRPRDGLYMRLASLLTVVQSTEVLLEISARRLGGNPARWAVIVVVEVVKYAAAAPAAPRRVPKARLRRPCSGPVPLVRAATATATTGCCS